MQKSIKKVQNVSMDDLILHISSYLEYLNNTCGLNVSVHFERDFFSRLPHGAVLMLLPYNSHTNTYCMKVKGIDHCKCLENQEKLLRVCERDTLLCHTCHAQVREYVYPIYKDDGAVGFISVSGYREKNTCGSGVVDRELWESILKEEIPLKLCHSLIPPLCVMLERLFERCLKESGSEYNMILQYLNEYHTNVTLSALAKHFNRSRSHISHLFKQKSGMTLNAYCNVLKLADAEKLVLKTDLPITKIAFDTGFSDTSYFIYLFKKKYGVSPLQYRRKTNKADM